MYLAFSHYHREPTRFDDVRYYCDVDNEVSTIKPCLTPVSSHEGFIFSAVYTITYNNLQPKYQCFRNIEVIFC